MQQAGSISVDSDSSFYSFLDLSVLYLLGFWLVFDIINEVFHNVYDQAIFEGKTMNSMEQALWQNMKRAYCFPDHCNCEAMQFGEWILQPYAFFSNIGFILVGLYLLFRFYRLGHQNAKRMLLSWNVIFIGIASGFLHASFIEVAALFDFGFIFMFMAWVSVGILFPTLDLLRFILVWAGLTSLPVLFISFFASQRINVFAVLLLPVIWLVIRFHRTHAQIKETNRLMRNALVSLSLAIVCVLTDRWRIFCFDELHLHGHSLWHLLDAISVYYIYRYFEYHQEDVDHL